MAERADNTRAHDGNASWRILSVGSVKSQILGSSILAIPVAFSSDAPY
jgi:hypothetical protein